MSAEVVEARRFQRLRCADMYEGAERDQALQQLQGRFVSVRVRGEAFELCQWYVKKRAEVLRQAVVVDAVSEGVEWPVGDVEGERERLIWALGLGRLVALGKNIGKDAAGGLGVNGD